MHTNGHRPSNKTSEMSTYLYHKKCASLIVEEIFHSNFCEKIFKRILNALLMPLIGDEENNGLMISEI